jgi:hypothetical protein
VSGPDTGKGYEKEAYRDSWSFLPPSYIPYGMVREAESRVAISLQTNTYRE